MNHSINSLFLFSTILLISFTHAIPSHQNLLSEQFSFARFLKPVHEPKLQRIIKMAQASSCLTNICFALDGSDTLTPADYLSQKRFAAVIPAIFSLNNPNTAYAAVQVTDRLTPISTLTTSANNFILNVQGSQFANSQRSSILPGITFCQQQLARRPGQAKKIVVFTNGRAMTMNSYMGETADSICAIGVGNQNSEVLRAIVGGDRTKVFQVTDFSGFLDVVEGLVREVCSN